ncbi:MAG TPA: TIGR01777 family oxidoreductase [Caldilineaceae bacterium]|nr:TIGR01777 family oxidoreductase [Caldilineaceae bacterium]
MRVIITGGTGLIGRALCDSLAADGHDIIVLTRNPARPVPLPGGVQLVQWDAQSAAGWGQLADGAGAIVNLAGESLAAGRWTAERKQRIYTSRLHAGKAVMEAITAAVAKPKVLVQASGIDYYGNRGDEILTEATSPGSNFLAQVCFDWEASTAAAERMGVRRPVIRTGLVLSKQGGAWPKIVLPFRLFAGGPMGSGRQYWPWIHLEDEVRAIRFLIDHPDATGPFNLTAPTPLTNREFAETLGRVMGRPSFFPAPAPALKLALGEMSMLLLDSRRAIPKRLQEMGFTFTYPTAEAAFRTLV